MSPQKGMALRRKQLIPTLAAIYTKFKRNEGQMGNLNKKCLATYHWLDLKIRHLSPC